MAHPSQTSRAILGIIHVKIYASETSLMLRGLFKSLTLSIEQAPATSNRLKKLPQIGFIKLAIEQKTSPLIPTATQNNTSDKCPL